MTATAIRRNGHDPNATIPDSRSLDTSGIGNGSKLVRSWQEPEPQPRRYIISGIAPEGAITAVYGDGGIGKSATVLHAAAHIATGMPWLGRETIKTNVLYLDAELDKDEHLRRAYQIARGLGMERPPYGLFYYRLEGSLADESTFMEADAARREAGAGVVIVDSLMVAASGADLEGAFDTVTMFKLLQGWGTVIVIDHIAKVQPGTNQSQYGQFGSVFKRNLSRSVLQLIQADAGGVLIRHTKHNFGPRSSPIGLSLDFTGNAIMITPVDPSDDRLGGIDDHLPAVERVYRALAHHAAGVTPESLADEIDSKVKTVRNHLTTLRQQGRADSADGVWHAIPDSRHTKEPGIGNGDQVLCRVCGSPLPSPADRRRGVHERCEESTQESSASRNGVDPFSSR